jgi:carbonic anhydrase
MADATPAHDDERGDTGTAAPGAATGDPPAPAPPPAPAGDRRTFLRRMGLAAGAITVAPAALAACSSAVTSSGSGTTTGVPGTQDPNATKIITSTGGPGTTVVVQCDEPSLHLPRPSTPAEVRQALVDGNNRFASGQSIHPDLGEELRLEQAEHQTPFAAILTCADSRVAPELIFDQGIGDLFAVRVAGNVADPTSVASLAYAVEVLHVDVIVVLGHENCGAVKTAIKVSDGSSAGEFAVLTDAIVPAVATAKAANPPKDQLLTVAIEDNAQLVASQLAERSPILRDAVAKGTLIIKAGMYNLVTSRVTLLD